MKLVRLSEKTDNCCWFLGENDMVNTYNFGGVEAFGLLFLDYTLITDIKKVRIERLKDKEEACDDINNQQNEN